MWYVWAQPETGQNKSKEPQKKIEGALILSDGRKKCACRSDILDIAKNLGLIRVLIVACLGPGPKLARYR